MTGACLLIGIIVASPLRTDVYYVPVHPQDIQARDIPKELRRLANSNEDVQALHGLPGYLSAPRIVKCQARTVLTSNRSFGGGQS